MVVPVYNNYNSPLYPAIGLSEPLEELRLRQLYQVQAADDAQRTSENKQQQQLQQEVLQEDLVATSPDNSFFADNINYGSNSAKLLVTPGETPAEVQNSLNTIIANTLYNQILGLNLDELNNNQQVLGEFSQPGLALLPDIEPASVVNGDGETLQVQNGGITSNINNIDTTDFNSINAPANDNISNQAAEVSYAATDFLIEEDGSDVINADEPKFWVVA